MARPTALTPEVQSRFVEAIKAGATVALAAEAAGIHRATAFRWLAAEGEFCVAVERARSSRCTRWLRTIEEHAGDDWKAAAWLLEHCNPEDFGKSVRTSVQEEIQSFLNGLKGKLGSAAWREILVAAAEARPDAVPRGAGAGAATDH